MRLENSKFVDLFVGQLKSTLRCQVCSHESVTFDPFWDLSLPIPSQTDQLRLQSCFDLVTEEEVLDDDDTPTCSQCKNARNAQRASQFRGFHKSWWCT